MATALPSFLLLGDSITELATDPALSGFHCLLQHDYIRRADIVNRGLSGYNTRWFLRYLPDILAPYAKTPAPLLVTLFLGANDANQDGNALHVPLDQYSSNLSTIVKKLKEAFPEAKLLLLTPPPISASRPWDLCNECTGTYAEACRKVAATQGVGLVDLWTEMQDDRESYLLDGLHLNAKGNQFVYGAILNYIASTWPKLSSTNLPVCFPTYEELEESELSRRN